MARERSRTGALGLERQERRAVQHRQRQQRQPGPDAVGGEDVDEAAGVLAVGVDREPGDHAAEADPEQQRERAAAQRGRPRPRPLPARRRDLLAELERGPARHQRHQHQQQRQIQAGEQRRVPGREGREHRRAGDDQPDLVAVPERADRAQRRPPLALVAADDGVQHADAEVEALQDEEPGPEEGDDDEPEGLERHVSRSGPERLRARSASAAGRAGRSGASARVRSTPSAMYSSANDGEADPDLGRAHRRRDAVRGLHQPLHDPRLAAVLGQHPAGRVHHERREHRPHGRAQEPLRRLQPAPGSSQAPHSASSTIAVAR